MMANNILLVESEDNPQEIVFAAHLTRDSFH